jgi:penicillin-binding protein 2
MVEAIIAGIVTLIAVVAVIVIVVKRRHTRNEAHVLPTGKVRSIETFGVNPIEQKGRFGPSQTASIPAARPSSGMPGEMLRPRFVAMGVLAAAVFGSLSAKLWSMQVLHSAQYSDQARENLYTTVYTPAPRGIIYDADGIALVKNRSSYTVLASADVAEDHDVILRLSALLGIPFEVVRQRILDTSSGAQNNRVVAEDVSLRNLAFISEHLDAFPGVICDTRTARTYPYGALGAHVLGYTGTISEEELAQVSEGRTVESGDMVGKSGIEQHYDDILAGDHGTRTLLTDASGNVQQVINETEPTRGNDVILTLRAPIQQVADNALREVIAPGGHLGGGRGTGGAIVCMDCRNGEVVAMASFPTFEPDTFIGGITQDMWNSFNTEESRYPLMNRAIAGTYPAASTFKAFVSSGALAYDVATKKSKYTCTGTWTGFGEDYPQNCWLLSGHGEMDIVSGIANSCDVVFYEIGKAFYEKAGKLGDDCLQRYIETFGFGSATGIDIYGEAAGRIPTPAWKAEYFKDVPEEAEWVGGDMSNMSIGQGYVLVTPLQMCCAYCGIATGTIYRPHLLKEVRNSSGETVVSVEPEVMAQPEMRDADISLVRKGLKEVIEVNQYTYKYFGDIGCTVAGKTGTAEVAGQTDYTWFACYAPADDPKYVVSCVCEQGAVTDTTTVNMSSQVLQAAIEYENNELESKLTSISATYDIVEYTVSSAGRSD